MPWAVRPTPSTPISPRSSAEPWSADEAVVGRRNLGAGAAACAAIAVAGLVIPGVLSAARPGGSDMETVALATPRSAITGTQMSETLKKTFPGGRFSQVTGQSNNPSDPSGGYVANGELVVDDGHGAASVGVSAVRLKLPLGDGDGLSCERARTPARAKGDTCELKKLPSSPALPGGALVMFEETADRHPAGTEPAHRWTVTLTLKKTGAQLQMVQWNSSKPLRRRPHSDADPPRPSALRGAGGGRTHRCRVVADPGRRRLIRP